jgi:hypothetical protein
MNAGYDFVRGGVGTTLPEPTDEQRRFAATLYATYVALCHAGFTDVAALQLVMATVGGVAASDS